ILAPAYFAREDTLTPVKIGLIALLVNFVLSVALAWWLVAIGYSAPHAGLALAISVAALVNAWLLYRGLRRDGVMVHSSGWLAFIARLFAANAAMVAAIYYLMRPLEWWLQADVAARVFLLSGTIAAAVAVFFAMLLLAGGRLSQLRLHER
ncbi:MAG: lipid II flippase MurJ, partial [Woeseia sp.]